MVAGNPLQECVLQDEVKYKTNAAGLTDFGSVGPLDGEGLSHKDGVSLSGLVLQSLLEMGTQRVYWCSSQGSWCIG